MVDRFELYIAFHDKDGNWLGQYLTPDLNIPISDRSLFVQTLGKDRESLKKWRPSSVPGAMKMAEQIEWIWVVADQICGEENTWTCRVMGNHKC